MRIALVSREVAPFFGAGIGTYVASMARAWRSAGHDVHVVSQNHYDLVKRGPEELAGAVCHGVAVRNSEYLFADLAAGFRSVLLKLHASAPFDYIEFPDYFADGYFAIRGARQAGELAGAVLGIRLHTPTHECRILNEEAAGGPAVSTLEKCEAAAIRAADVVISPSRSLLAMVGHRLGFDTPGFVVPYPFEVDRAISMAASSTDPTTRPSVLYFGRLERRKGVELLAEAAQRLLRHGTTNVLFRFMGGDTKSGPQGGSMRAHLRGQIEPQWTDRFVFKNQQPQVDVWWWIRSVALGGGVCCFPSRWENFPNVCLEAMSLGAPVVASDAGGMSEIIEDGVSGVLFKSGDAESLAAALSQVLSDDALRRRISEAAPTRIRSLCDPASITRQMIAAIEVARHTPRTSQSFEEVSMPSPQTFEEVPMPAEPAGSRMRRWAAIFRKPR